MAAISHSAPLVSASPIHTKTLSQRNKSKPNSNGPFSYSKTIDELKQLHCDLTKRGLNHRLANVTELVLKCAEMGTSESLLYARSAFEVFKEEERSDGTLFMYNSLIRGYSSAGLGLEAVSIYVEMTVKGILPDNYTLPFVLSGCAKSGFFSEGAQLHGASVKMGLDGDMFVRNSLIHFYAECGELEDARKVFDEMPERNVVSWTSLICGYARREFPGEAVSLFFEMVREGVKPNSVTMVCVISACSKLNDLGVCERVHGYIENSATKLNSFMVNALVDMYLKCGDSESAKRIFEASAEKSLVLCNTMMSNFVRQGKGGKEALSILREMLRCGPRPDRITILSAISACSQLSDNYSGRCCHGYALRNNLESWESISNAVIDMYMKFGKKETARRVFDEMKNKNPVSWNSLISGFIRHGDARSAWRAFEEMPERDLVSWNTMIGALVGEGRFEDAVGLFREMQSKGVQADRVTIMEIASACGSLGTLDLAKWVELYVRKNGIACDLRLGTALVGMFARCGDSQAAMRVFEGMPRRDVSAWTAAIGAMAMEGNGKRAVELFDEMLGHGVKPDGVVFVALLTACSHGGFVEQGRKIFEAMERIHRTSPEIIHYGCMVDLLGRAGMLKEARDVIEAMPMKPNDVIWGSFLSACRTHKDVEMADYAAKRVKELTSEKSGVHVLMSNIYASAGRWNEVAEVRLRLKERGIRKKPGTSLIEVDGVIHEFTSNDESHPKRRDIESMLEEMNGRLRDADHVPDLANVLLDVDEAEKEYFLGRHSEKLAIAFGLVGKAQGEPIRVTKNLRMCSDCHSFAKLISRIYAREIVVRDCLRFHFFRNGFCSCRDYW